MSKPIKTDVGEIAHYILHIRGTRVILDSDLARIYGVQTKRLNEQVKRNKDRFPQDFMFRLTDDEVSEVVANCDHLKKLKFSNYNPFAFTEHEALMLSAVLNTQAAVETSIYIVRAFVKIRTLLATHSKLEKKITEMENKYDKQFAIVFEALKLLIRQDNEPRKRIGFRTDHDQKDN